MGLEIILVVLIIFMAFVLGAVYMTLKMTNQVVEALYEEVEFLKGVIYGQFEE